MLRYQYSFILNKPLVDADDCPCLDFTSGLCEVLSREGRGDVDCPCTKDSSPVCSGKCPLKVKEGY